MWWDVLDTAVKFECFWRGFVVDRFLKIVILRPKKLSNFMDREMAASHWLIRTSPSEIFPQPAERNATLKFKVFDFVSRRGAD